MKKILVLLCLLPAMVFGQNENVRHTVTGTAVNHTRGGTTLKAQNTDYANTANPVFSGVVKLAPNDTLATKAYARGYAGGGGEGSLGWFNVEAYGALADGSDDQPEIQAAIDACVAAGGGIVYCPAGTYWTSSSLTVGSNTIIKGVKGNTIFKARTDWAASGTAMFTTANGAHDIVFEDICIDGNNKAFSDIPIARKQIFGFNDGNGSPVNVTFRNMEIRKTSQFAASVSTTTRCTFENVYIHNTGDTLNAGGIYSYGGVDLVVSNCKIDSTKQHGMYIGAGRNITISNSFFRWAGYNAVTDVDACGISLRPDSNVVVIGNQIMYNRSYGMTIIRSDAGEPDIRNVVIIGNNISRNKGTTTGATTYGTQMFLNHTSRVLIASNIIGPKGGTEATQYGIRFYDDNNYTTITGNTFYVNCGIYGTYTLNNATIKGNVFTGENGSLGTVAIDLNSDAGSYADITDNDIYYFTRGIRLLSSYAVGYTLIKNNNMSNTSIPITNLSAATNHNIEIKGSSAFTTTADRKAIFIDGLNTDYDAMVTADQGSDAVHPVAADLMSAYCKADSLIVKRVAGTGGTSGLKFKYVVNND